VKLGHWYAPVGYEVVPTTGNFFPNLPYTSIRRAIYYDRRVASYQYNENVSFGGGVNHGWDNFASSLNPHCGLRGLLHGEVHGRQLAAIANTPATSRP